MLGLHDFQKRFRLPNLPPLFHELQDFFRGQIEAGEAIDHELVVSCNDTHGGLALRLTRPTTNALHIEKEDSWSSLAELWATQVRAATSSCVQKTFGAHDVHRNVPVITATASKSLPAPKSQVRHATCKRWVVLELQPWNTYKALQ